MTPWIGVDFDGTLATYEGDQFPACGEPIPLMVGRVKQWLAEGKDVQIVTARADKPEHITPVEDWCETHLGHRLPVRADKDFMMIELWDDRAKQVIPNTGLAVERLLLAIWPHYRSFLEIPQ
mgnify:CR=1 FL=1